MKKRLRKGGSALGGFTLIELLVVISIITLLISILLPSLSRARESARQLVCRNNLRNIWSGVLQYSLNNKDRAPFMEDVNLTDPEADPFDPRREYKTTVGRVLHDYVNQKTWICPSAIKGFPEHAGPGGWKMTYWFRTAGAIGEGIPFSDQVSGTGGSMDPVVSNYVNFDGRPLRLVSGRRHTPSNRRAPNHDNIGPWTYSFPIIADLIDGDETAGRTKYPHFGVVDKRLDLQASRSLFEQNSGTGRLPARMELHAEGERNFHIFLTRSPFKHQPGF